MNCTHNAHTRIRGPTAGKGPICIPVGAMARPKVRQRPRYELSLRGFHISGFP